MLIDKIHRSVAGMAISEPFATSTIKPFDWAADASARVADDRCQDTGRCKLLNTDIPPAADKRKIDVWPQDNTHNGNRIRRYERAVPLPDRDIDG
jgi:hypothetical protein